MNFWHLNSENSPGFYHYRSPIERANLGFSCSDCAGVIHDIGRDESPSSASISSIALVQFHALFFHRLFVASSQEPASSCPSYLISSSHHPTPKPISPHSQPPKAVSQPPSVCQYAYPETRPSKYHKPSPSQPASP